MDEAVRNLFRRYQDFFMRSLAGDVDAEEIAGLYASEFIAASPAGVLTGKNDETLVRAMVQSYDYYRKIGTQEMTIRGLRVSSINECHCVAHVSWTGVYSRDNLSKTAIDFDVHYLVQVLNHEAKVFGWVSGDEQALLKQHGIV